MSARDDSTWLDIHPRDLLPRLGLSARKAFGQNFLVRPGALDRVVEAAQVGPGDVVLEIGTGIGRLTGRLAARADRVVTVEIDRGLYAVAGTHLEAFGNVTRLCCDFLARKHAVSAEVTGAAAAAVAEHGGPLRVVSNLPYSISSPAIVNLLEWEVTVGDMHLMLQREVAGRILAGPGTRAYGPLTVTVAYWAEAERVFNLPRRAFWPVPDVASTLLRITRRAGRTRTPAYEAFAATVHRLFMGRRKRLARALRDGWGAEVAAAVPAELGIDPDTRPDCLTVAEYEAIAALAGAPSK